jgi:hypothetical protein
MNMLGQTDVFGPAAAALAALFVAAGPIAVGVAKVVDLIRNLFGDRQVDVPSWVWNVVAFAVGIAAALGWGINLLAPVVAQVPALASHAGTNDTLGQVLTGIVLGAMAGFWHDKMAQWAAAHQTFLEPAPTVTRRTERTQP